MSRQRRKTVRRIVLGLLCAVLCGVGVWGIPRLVDWLTRQTGTYTYVLLEDGTAMIREYHGQETAVVIPAELDGHAVSRIGEKAFSWRILMKSVTVPRGIEIIDDGAFMGCVGLSGVTLPEGLTAIGANAFSKCQSLESLAIPQSVKDIGDNAFEDCVNLSRINIPDGLTSFGANPFLNCRSLRDLTLSQNHPALARIGSDLCDGTASRLILRLHGTDASSLELPDTVTVIGAGAFARHPQITDASLPEGVTAVESHAFFGCDHLTRVVLPTGVTSLGNAVFSECAHLSEVVLPDTLTEIGYLAFYGCADLTEVAIPASVTSIGEGCFIGCPNLIVTVEPGSYAERYCTVNDLPCRYGPRSMLHPSVSPPRETVWPQILASSVRFAAAED